MVVVDGDKVVSRPLNNAGKVPVRQCIFELVYFARPDSIVFGEDVYQCRKHMGYEMAKEAPTDAELVMPFPDSGVYAAIGFAHAAGVPYEQAYIRNHYVGRTFIQPSQTMRNFGVRVKLNPVRSMIKNRRICIVDDSIVRGTQLRETTEFLYQSGAKEVHVRPACPPLLYGCKFLNFSRSKSELDLITRRIILEKEGENAEKVLEEYADPTSARYESMCQEICRRQNFTSLRYHRLDDLVESIGLPKCKMCTYCFDGKE